MARVGLVLGAGGVVGQAHHAGVLAALEHDLGWDPRTADAVVGTSAGAITGALLRSGARATDLAAWTVKAPLSVEGDALREVLDREPPVLEPYRPSHLLRLPRLPRPELVARALRRPWQFRPMAAAMALVAPGRLDIVQHLEPLRAREATGGWPDRALWVCTVRRRDGRRVVFGAPGSPPAPLHLAVAASCAIPGYFAPVKIGGRAYVDGGAHSPTNAAVLHRDPVDLAVVVSPMSGPAQVPTNLDAVLRQHARRRLQREVHALRAAGTAVVTFEPGPDEQAVMGSDLLSRDRVDDVVREAFLAAGRHAAMPPVRSLLAPLAAHRGRRPR